MRRAEPPPRADAAVGRARGDPAARAIAERWFKALADGDAAALTSLAVLPFKTSAKDVTKRGALSAMLTDLAGEEKSSRARTLRALHDRRPARRHRQAARERRRRQRHAALRARLERTARRAHPDPRQARRRWRPVGLVRR